MKKNTYILITLILLISSCKKHNTNDGGSWTFKGQTFNMMGCSATSGVALSYYSGIAGGTSTAIDNRLSVEFGTWLLPTIGLTDTVISGMITSTNQANISMILGYTSTTGLGGTHYHSTGGNGNQTISISVSSAGKIAVSGSSIMMVNDTLPSDSALLNFNISQTN